MQTRDDALLAQIDAYNEEDCIATLLLRDWLLALRDDAIAQFGPFPQPEPKEIRETPPAKVERAALRARLLDAGEELAAQLLDYHDRERKPVWWAFFDRVEMTLEELIEDSESIARLEVVSGPEPEKKSCQVRPHAIPAQEHKIGEGQEVMDPATREGAGDVLAVDREAREVVLKRGPKLDDVPLPQALIPGGPYRTPAQEDALMRIGSSLLAGDRRFPAVESILRREPFDRDVQTSDVDELKALVRSLDGRHLVIQGPPGSGKTWISGAADRRPDRARQARRRRVDEPQGDPQAARGGRGGGGGDRPRVRGQEEGERRESRVVLRGRRRIENVTDSSACTDCDLTAGTAWHFARDEHERTLDFLFIDEAGQVSLADALAMATAARNVVLVGDPQQLAQVLAGHASRRLGRLGAHAPARRRGDDPPDRGVFLERTFRLHPDVCRYISEEFYEGRLHSRPDHRDAHDSVRHRAPLHRGAPRRPPAGLAGGGRRGECRGRRACSPPAFSDVMVVAAYNAQVNALREALPAAVRVGTVDKFQGQEADVVLYSMASSSGEDVPRGLEFLLSRNRLNVAISRARCLAYLVASPRLLEVNCRTIPQMRLANALCRFVELAPAAARALT